MITPPENLVNLILSEAKKGNVVLLTIEGLVSANLNNLLSQPAEGILYDLNRLPETVLTFIDDKKWINDYAVALVIMELKKRLEATELEMSLKRAEEFLNAVNSPPPLETR
jgi:hypothetical protein